jgi:gluconate kinase
MPLMNKQLLIVFGKPGAGKSYVAKILEDHFGYFSYNGDEAIPVDMKNTLFRKEHITDDMRKRFLKNMIAEIKKISEKHTKLVIHQTFLKEYMRKQLLTAFPLAQFVLVECDDAVRETRYMKRKYFNLGIEYLRHMTSLFEAPRVSHVAIYNNKEGPKNITDQVASLVRLSQFPK